MIPKNPYQDIVGYQKTSCSSQFYHMVFFSFCLMWFIWMTYCNYLIINKLGRCFVRVTLVSSGLEGCKLLVSLGWVHRWVSIHRIKRMSATSLQQPIKVGFQYFHPCINGEILGRNTKIYVWSMNRLTTQKLAYFTTKQPMCEHHQWMRAREGDTRYKLLFDIICILHFIFTCTHFDTRILYTLLWRYLLHLHDSKNPTKIL
jgi:hypothetical protein